MHAVVASFWLPRGGSGEREYEDAFYPKETGTRSAARMHFAVADGVSEGMLSGQWAELLVRTFCESRRRKIHAVLESAAAAWEEEVAQYITWRVAQGRPIQWFEEPGLTRGAHATLLGLEFGTRRATAGHWSAVSIGDTCVFQVRADELVAAFPIDQSGGFDITPGSVPSRPHDLDAVVDIVTACQGEWRARDHFYLGTDAISRWFLQEVEAGEQPWKQLETFDPEIHQEFGAWVRSMRQHGRMRDDDVTLIRVGIL